MRELAFRQIHLDFHTSGRIEGIGADFDPQRFAETLAEAGVDSVTCFARCHHGYLYYPSKRHPERIHPHLSEPDLLGPQIEACHARGIRVPVYTTVQWDAYTAIEHRDWLCVDEAGREYETRPLEAGFYRFLDVFHPGYRQFMRDHLADMFACLPAVDGVFLDIVQPKASLAWHWLEAMEEAGVDPEDGQQRQTFARRVLNAWKLETSQFIRELPQFQQDCTIFYNAGHVGPRHLPTQAAYTHYELESLPSGGWGYLHFPLTQRYARNLGKPTLGMTGKFHTTWGDFHSYKNEAALAFECFHMLALGARCSIGDQLPPDGQLDEATYQLIQPIYRSVQAKEPWCRDVEPMSQIGVITPESFAPELKQSAPMLGLVRMLQELQHQFEIISPEQALEQYELVILPDEIPVDAELAGKLKSYLEGGGALIASHRAGLASDEERFALDAFGVEARGEAAYQPDFLMPGEALGRGLPRAAHVMYERAMAVRPGKGTEVLLKVHRPHFNRTWRHYCSHQHAPAAGESDYPGATQRGRVIYFAHPIFRQYNACSPRWVRVLLGEAIERLLSRPLVRVDGPSTLLATLNRQPSTSRLVLHLLHYVPERRGAAFDVVEDVIPLHEVGVTLGIDEAVTSVRLAPEGDDISFEQTEGQVRFTVPRVHGHAMVEVGLKGAS